MTGRHGIWTRSDPLHCLWCSGRIVCRRLSISAVYYAVEGVLTDISGGFLLWKIFLAMDSDRYPLKSYGDIAFRVFGSGARHGVNVLQSVQLLFNVGIIIIVNGQSLAQVSSNGACFIILCFVW